MVSGEGANKFHNTEEEEEEGRGPSALFSEPLSRSQHFHCHEWTRDGRRRRRRRRMYEAGYVRLTSDE